MKITITTSKVTMATFNLIAVLCFLLITTVANGKETNKQHIPSSHSAYYFNNAYYFNSENIETKKMLSSNKTGDALQAVIEETCAYDKQMCTADPESPMARLTNVMTGDALKSVLGDTNWIYEDSLYPRLKFPADEIEEMRFIDAANNVSAAPVFLRIRSDSNFDTYENIRNCFAVSRKNGVRWRSVNGNVEISPYTNFVRLLTLGWDTLIAYIELPIPAAERINASDSVDIIAKAIPIHITGLNNNCDFSAGPFTVELSAMLDTMGTVTGGGTHDAGSKITIRAVANEGHIFRYWSNLAGDTISRNAEFELTVTSDTALIAHFRLRSFSVSVQASPINMGTVTGTTSGAYSYNYAGVSTATSTNDSLFVFVNWTGRAIATGSKLDTLSNEPTLHFWVKSDTIIIANFDIKISVEENINLETISIIPNPTRDDFTVSFEVIKSDNIEVKLLDLSGREVLLIHNDFAPEGIFSKIVNTANLSRGVYYLKVQVGKNFTVEKVVME